MIKSMTGYGRGEASGYDRRFIVEIKSVNHRYNDINIKLPRILNEFEEKIKSFLTSHIKRGKTDVYIQLESFASDDIDIHVNTALADSYVKAMEELKNRYNKLDDDLTLSLVAAFPDVITVHKNVDTDENMNKMWEVLCIALDEAVKKFMSMRISEGESLKADILNKRQALKNLTKEIQLRAPYVVVDHEKKLKEKIGEALKGVPFDEMRFMQEITIFSDKSCIDEEITRLTSHIEQLKDILDEESSVGKKLDFLVQEMNREINTIGSKSNDIQITRTVIDMKSEVEKIREQVQNLE